MQGPPEVFRLSFLSTFSLLLLWFWVLGLAVGSLFLLATGLWSQVTADALLVSLAVFGGLSLILLVPLTGLVVWYFKVFVHPDGLRCCDAWGLYRSVAWSDITGVRPLNLVGLRYLLVSSSSLRGALWLPVYLVDRHRFAERVCQAAGPEHPLSRALGG
jgi:hypothetical protein